jgi:hypothetical protein
MKRDPLDWLSRLVRTGTGALRPGNGLLKDTFLPIPAELAKKKGAAKAPYGSHRSNLSEEAARLFPTYHGRPTGFDPQPL